MVNPNNRGGKPIRGKLDPFKKALDPIFVQTNTENGVEIFRDYLKDAIALRLQYTTIKTLKIPKECFDIIKERINNNNIYSFVKCTLQYYNNEKNHKDIQLDTTCSCCNAKEDKKSAQHAKNDCKVCASHYMGKLKKKCPNKGDSISEKRLNKYSSIESAINFVSEYIYSLLIGEMPNKIKKETYDRIVVYDKSIKDLYSYISDGGYYKKIDNKLCYKSVSMKTATEIFCDNYVVTKM